MHEGEWVANHKTVNNPAVRPVLDFLDMAQRNNRVGSLTADDISRQLGQGGSAVVAPVVNVQTNNDDLQESIDNMNDNNDRLIKVLEKGITAISDPEQTYRDMQIMKMLKDNTL